MALLDRGTAGHLTVVEGLARSLRATLVVHDTMDEAEYARMYDELDAAWAEYAKRKHLNPGRPGGSE